MAHGDRQFDHVRKHGLSLGNVPTDIVISEYIEGWNEEALKESPHERDRQHRNRVIELYNGSDKTIDLGNDQYFLEIYAGPGNETTRVAAPPPMVRRTISLESDVTFDFDKSAIRVDADADLRKVVQVLNEADLFSEIVIAGHSCDLGPDEYNLALSTHRAASVRDLLLAAGLEVPAIRIQGHGEATPRLPNDSQANRSRNRRVDITFVTREGEEIERTVSEADGDSPGRYTYTFLRPQPGTVVGDVADEPLSSAMLAGEYKKGDMNPRQVIGLNGAIEPGETHVVVFDQSDEVLTDAAHLVTGQLDFSANETLVVRRLGGEMALSCRAQSYHYVMNYPAIPIIRLPGTFPRTPPRVADAASPN